jgi:hypothetical protein
MLYNPVIDFIKNKNNSFYTVKITRLTIHINNSEGLSFFYASKNRYIHKSSENQSKEN